MSTVRLFLLGFAAMSLGGGTALAASGQEHGAPALKNAAKKQPHARGASPASRGRPQSRPEVLQVVARVLPGGVTNTTPGGGLMPVQTVPRVQNSVTRDYIAKQSPTTNTLSLLQMMPGVVVGTSDPLGLADHNSITVRGMGQTEIGMIFEGMPAGDPIYDLADTSEWADTENIGRIDLTPGSSDISAPTYSAIGGQITETLRDPSHNRGGELSLSGGTHATNKDFLRLDSGEIGRSGVAAFISGSYTRNNNWRGPGTNRRYHVDAKVVKEWGRGSRAAAVFTWNSIDESPTRYISLSQWEQYGRSYNYAGSFNLGSTDYYRLYQYKRTSMMISAPMHFRINRYLSADLTPYYQWMSGLVPSGSTLTPGKVYNGASYAGQIDFPTVYKGNAIVAANAGSQTFNTGFSGKLTLHTGVNTLSAGYWYGNLAKSSLYDYSPVSASGQIMDTTIGAQNGSVVATKNFNFYQQVNAFFIEDRLSLLNDKLILAAGFRDVLMARSGTNALPGANYRWGANGSTPLPRFEASYSFNEHHQIFINATTGFHAPASDVFYYDAFNVSTGKLSTQGKTALKNEYSISESIGYRYTGLVTASVAFFNYNFTNRQISSLVYVNGALSTSFINAGGQTSRGVEAEVALRPWHHFSPYVSGQYLHSTTDNNIAVGNDLLPTRGKTAVMSPKFTASAGVSYDDGRIFGSAYFNYVDSQYSTFMNDESIPAYKTGNVTVGYRLDSIGFLRHPQIQANFINIGDENYLSGIYTAQTNAKTTKGVYGTSIAGSAPTYYLGGGFAAVVSLTTDF